MQNNTTFYLSLSILVQILCVYAPRLLFSSISFVQYHWIIDVIVILMCIHVAEVVLRKHPPRHPYITWSYIYIFAYILVYTCAHVIGFALLTWCPKELLLLPNNFIANRALELLGAPTIIVAIAIPNLFLRLRDVDTAIASALM